MQKKSTAFLQIVPAAPTRNPRRTGVRPNHAESGAVPPRSAVRPYAAPPLRARHTGLRPAPPTPVSQRICHTSRPGDGRKAFNSISLDVLHDCPAVAMCGTRKLRPFADITAAQGNSRGSEHGCDRCTSVSKSGSTLFRQACPRHRAMRSMKALRPPLSGIA